MTRLETILTKYNFPKRVTRPISKVKDLEDRIGFPFPDDYKFYLENYEEYEEFIGPELVNLWGMDELLFRNKDTGIFDNLPLTLGIGNNQSSEFIAIELIDNKNYRIVLSPFIDLAKQQHIEIGKSFTDFFVRLDNGIGWFE